MTVAGSPSWTRSATAATYGGHSELEDFAAQGAVDPKTDISAAEYKRICADVAAIQRTAALARIRLVCRDTPSALPPTVKEVAVQSGLRLQQYTGNAPPSGFPTITRYANGAILVVLPATLADDFGITAAPEVHSVQGSIIASAAGSYELTWEPLTTLSFRVYAWKDGVALPNAEINFEIF